MQRTNKNTFLKASCFALSLTISLPVISSLAAEAAREVSKVNVSEKSVEIRSDGQKRILKTPRLDVLTTGNVVKLGEKAGQKFVDIKLPTETVHAYQIAPSDVAGELKAKDLGSYMVGRESYYKLILSSDDGVTHFQVSPTKVETLDPTQIRVWYGEGGIATISNPIGPLPATLVTGKDYEARFLTFQAPPKGAESTIPADQRADYMLQPRRGGAFTPNGDGTFNLVFRDIAPDGALVVPFKSNVESSTVDKVLYDIRRGTNPLNADIHLPVGGTPSGAFARFTLINPMYDARSGTLTAKAVPLVDIDGTSAFDYMREGYEFSDSRPFHVDFGNNGDNGYLP